MKNATRKPSRKKATRREVRRESPTPLPEVLAALANKGRRALLIQLARGPCDVSSLSSAIGLSMPAVSLNLRRLREAKLVQVEQKARRRIYSLCDHVKTHRGRAKTQLTVLARGGQSVTIEVRNDTSSSVSR